MINPYTIEVLNAERLKDLDRERAELYLASLVRPKRRRACHVALDWLGTFDRNRRKAEEGPCLIKAFDVCHEAP